MKVGKFTAIFLSVIAFVVIVSVLAIFVASFINLDSSYNWIIRIVLFLTVGFIAKKFYDFIYGDVELKEGKNDVAVYSDEDKKRKMAVLGVLLVFIMAIVYISVGVLFFSDTGDNNSDVSTINSFNNSKVSFNYSSNWTVESNNSTDILLSDSDGYYLYISAGDSDGYSLDDIYDLYKSAWEDTDNITIVNSSHIDVNGIPAIATYLNISSNDSVKIDEDISKIASFFNIKPNEIMHTNSYEVIMVKNNKYYTISYYHIDNSVNEEEFKIFINSFKIE